jgi:methionyl-tRNA formyltransferase
VRVTFFGLRGPFSHAVLTSVAGAFEVTTVIVPADRARPSPRRVLDRAARALGLRRDPIAHLATEIGAKYHVARSRADPSVDALLAGSRPDVILTALYRWILPVGVYGAARLGGFNVHPSLLPRHRGPLPLFWVYYHDDRQSGVTIHRLDAQVDAGPILGQASLEVPRGLSVDELYHRKAALAGPLTVDALSSLDDHRLRLEPQDEASATWAPLVDSSRPMVDYAWSAERVWHFLAGLYPRFKEPLSDANGDTIRYRGVLGFTECEPAQDPGTVRRDRGELRVYCRNGFVRLEPGPRGPLR